MTSGSNCYSAILSLDEASRNGPIHIIADLTNYCSEIGDGFLKSLF